MAEDVKGATLKWDPVDVPCATDGRSGLLGRALTEVKFGGGNDVAMDGMVS